MGFQTQTQAGVKKNTTRTVRLLDSDIALLDRLSGLDPAVPFAVRAHAVLRRLASGGGEAELDRVRLVMREELERFAAGVN